MTVLIVPIAVFFCVACLVGAAATYLTARTEPGVEDRLAVLTGSTSAKQAKDALLKGSVLAHPLEGTQSALLDVLHAAWATSRCCSNRPIRR